VFLSSARGKMQLSMTAYRYTIKEMVTHVISAICRAVGECAQKAAIEFDLIWRAI